MPTQQLTVRTVDAIKLDPTRQVDYWDSSLPRFGLRVSPGGRKTWIVFYRLNGRPRRLTLGTYPSTKLVAARERASVALRDVDAGSDPATVKADERRADTFADLAHEYVERHAKHKRSGREDSRILYGSPQKKKTGKRPHEALVKRWGAMKRLHL